MQWYKKLTQSDAQQETQGSLMPFRFTKENLVDDLSWFRNTFFDTIEWKLNKEYTEETAEILFNVNINGKHFNEKTMILSYKENRTDNHNAPTMHLKFDRETREYLSCNNMAGYYIVFMRDSGGNFNLTIQTTKPN